MTGGSTYGEDTAYSTIICSNRSILTRRSILINGLTKAMKASQVYPSAVAGRW